MYLSIVIPVFNGDSSLEELTDRIIEVFRREIEYEIIMVYDQGSVKSWDKIKELKGKYPCIVNGLKLNRNYGQHKALMCGFHYTTGDIIVTIDEDLQYEPYDIPKLLDNYIQTKADLVYGVPEKYMRHFLRNISSDTIHKILSLFVKNLDVDFTSFRLLKGQLARQVAARDYPYIFIDGILAGECENIHKVLVNHNIRTHGNSAWGWNKLILHISNIFIYYTILPIFMLIAFIAAIIILFIADVLPFIPFIIISVSIMVVIAVGAVNKKQRSKPGNDFENCVNEMI